MTARARTTAIVAVAFCALTAASLTRAFLDRGPGLAAGAATIVAGVTTILGWRRTRVGVTVGALTVAVVTVAAVVLADGAFPGDVVRTVTNGAGDLLTTRWPAAATPTAVGLVVLLGAAAGWLTAVAAARRTIGPTILLPGVALLAVGALLAAPAGPPGSPMLAAMTAAALATLRLAAIARHPDEGPATTGDLRTALSAQRFAALGALALVVAPLAAAPYTAGGERFDPRDSRDDPTNRFDDLSPLTVVEELRKIDPPVPVIQVDGNDVGSWRIAAMNRYDGRAWMAPEVFKPTTLRREDHRPDRTVRVTLRRPIGRWLPVPDGHVLAVDRSVRTEATNAGLLSESAVKSRERYTVSLDDPAAPTRPAAVDPNPKLRPTLSGYEPPLRVRQLASQVIAQAGTDEQRAEAIAQFLRREYRLDEESPAGHSALLIESFLFDTK
ncbi:MAG TPA: transglutaminaseTgpA domain-containing protein, partial [Microthrixaceae bacterium]|nr:transglutaminaseTgpA domain-containing protein [Microthrixaceae bacterium]